MKESKQKKKSPRKTSKKVTPRDLYAHWAEDVEENKEGEKEKVLPEPTKPEQIKESKQTKKLKTPERKHKRKRSKKVTPRDLYAHWAEQGSDDNEEEK